MPQGNSIYTNTSSMSSRVEDIVRRRVSTEIEKYPVFQRAAVALSGGKDSRSILHVFR